MKLFKPCLIIILYSFLLSCKTSQTPYLGTGMKDKYETSSMMKDSKQRYAYYSFLGYHTLQSKESGYMKDSTVTRLGVILPGEHLENETINGNAFFGNNNDVSIIDYSVQLQKKYEGRSALLSILNLFSKEKDQKPQQPYEVLQAAYINGTIRTGEKLTTFYYERKHKTALKGWVCYNGDTLVLQTLSSAINEKGEMVKAKQSVKLMKKDMIVAALNFLHKPFTIYMLKDIDSNKRLVAASYLFVFALQNYYLKNDPANQLNDRYDE